MSSMRVGTDAVLLGAWAEIKNAKKILEIGTGSGIIALMMAQRNELAQITAIDIHPESIDEATGNFAKSAWSQRLNAELISLQIFKDTNQGLFDHIISNPPYFSDSTPAPDKSRNQARHTTTLSHQDFFLSCRQLLQTGGKISLIIPSYDSKKWMEIALVYNLCPSRITNVISYPGKTAERVLVELSTSILPLETSELFIRKGKGLGYSDEYIKLTEEFYL